MASTKHRKLLTAEHRPGDVGANNVHEVEVQVDDGNGNTATQLISVTVTPVDEFGPSITSLATANVAENTTAVLTVTATDADLPGDTLSFSITGSGADDALFTIDGSSGALRFLAAPDYEAPGDVGANNVYEVEVQVDDGSGSTTQRIVVAVVPLNVSAEEIEELVEDSEPPANPTPEGESTDSQDPVAAEATEQAPVLETSFEFDATRNDPAIFEQTETATGYQLALQEEEQDRSDTSPEVSDAEPRATLVGELGTRDIIGRALPEEFDHVAQEMERDGESIRRRAELVVTRMEQVGLALSTGVLWLLFRASSLLALALNSVPAWRSVDPLTVLALSRSERRQRQREFKAAEDAEDAMYAGVGKLLDKSRLPEQGPEPDHRGVRNPFTGSDRRQ